MYILYNSKTVETIQMSDGSWLSKWGLQKESASMVAPNGPPSWYPHPLTLNRAGLSDKENITQVTVCDL